MNKFDQLVDKVLKEDHKKKLPTQLLSKGWLPKSGGPMVTGKQKAKDRDKRIGRKDYNKGEHE